MFSSISAANQNNNNNENQLLSQNDNRRPISDRLKALLNANIVYYWSIKEKKLITLTRESARSRHDQPCDLCIPTYDASRRDRLGKTCFLKIKSYPQFVAHLYAMQKQFRRQLVFLDESEIPPINRLDRRREIGDLKVYEKEPVLKIHFKTVKLIDYRTILFDYLRMNGCPCKGQGVGRCEIKMHSKPRIFGHLASVEKRENRYIVFRATAEDRVKSDINCELSVANHVKVINVPSTGISVNQQNDSSSSSNGSSENSLSDDTIFSTENVERENLFRNNYSRIDRIEKNSMSVNDISLATSETTANSTAGSSARYILNSISSNSSFLSTINNDDRLGQ